MVGRRWEKRVERWQQGVNCSYSWASPPLLPPSPPPPDAMAGSVCLHYAAVEVCDRGAAGGESPGNASVKDEHYAADEVGDRGVAGGESMDNASMKGERGTKPFDRRHRHEWDPRLDGGSTSLIVAKSGTPELTAAARHPRSRQRTSGLALY